MKNTLNQVLNLQPVKQPVASKFNEDADTDKKVNYIMPTPSVNQIGIDTPSPNNINSQVAGILKPSKPLPKSAVILGGIILVGIAFYFIHNAKPSHS